MKYIAYLFSILLIASITACGGGSEEEEEIEVSKNPLQALMKMGQEMEKQAKLMEERQKDGNVEAIHYEELYNYLPESISGYERGEPTGASIEAQGMSYSSAEVRYTSDDGDLKVVILDYYAAFGLYTMATSAWMAGIKIDTPEETASGVKFSDEAKGWQSFRKKSGKASIVLGIGSRFMLTVEADNQEDTEYVKEVVKSMDLDGLASL